MLNLTRDTECKVNLWMNGNTSLTYLTIVINPTCINSSTRSTNLTMKNLSKLEELVETFL